MAPSDWLKTQSYDRIPIQLTHGCIKYTTLKAKKINDFDLCTVKSVYPLGIPSI